jgi:hypothetical protein
MQNLKAIPDEGVVVVECLLLGLPRSTFTTPDKIDSGALIRAWQ